MPPERDVASAVTRLVRKDLVDRTFCTPPGIELASLGSLPLSRREAILPSHTSARGLWIVRAPADRGGTIKVIHASTARFLRRHRRAGAVASVAAGSPLPSLPLVVARLVLDGLLELETEAGFVGGPAALRDVINPARMPRAHDPRDRIGVLSIEALRYAAALPRASAWSLAQRLYAFNTWPATAAWRRRLPGPDAVQAWLAIAGASGVTARALRRSWTPAHAPARSGWFAWIPRRARASRPRFKIYVSPVPDALPDAFATVVRVLSELGAPHMKVGRDLAGILRPDKVVVHLHTREAMRRVMRALATALDGTPAQGVPLSAAGPDPAGLFSWGIDPPRRDLDIVGRGIESWRGWLARQFAAHLASAGAADGGVERWEFARARLALDGVDTDRWLPLDLPGAR